MWKVFLLLIGVGALFIKYFHEGFFHSFGHAFIIAGILSWSVDFYVKEHLVRAAVRDIDKYLLGYALPSDLQDKLREIRDAKLVRRNFVCEFTILPIQGEKKIKLDTHLTFEVENITNQRQDFTAELVLDKYTSPEITLISCESNDSLARYRLEGPALSKRIEKGIQTNPNAAMVGLSADSVRLLRKSRHSFIYYKFHYKYSQIYPDVGSDHFQFDQPFPTINVRLIVNHPIGFSISFPSEPYKVRPTKIEWADEKVFLRGEIITFWWRSEN